MLRPLTIGMASLIALVPTQISAQAGGEVTMYTNGHFKRPGPTMEGPTRLQTPFVMKSVRIPEGAVWEFCSGKSFTGCREIGQSVEAMVMTVRSARPVAGVLPSTASTGGGVVSGATGVGQSLRGMAAEFFVAPDQSGNRVEVQPGTSEAMSRRAEEFCRARGWHSAAHARLQSIDGRFYLADVLCVKA